MFAHGLLIHMTEGVPARQRMPPTSVRLCVCVIGRTRTNGTSSNVSHTCFTTHFQRISESRGFDKRQNRMLGSFDRDVACFHESDGLFLYDGHKTWCGLF